MSWLKARMIQNGAISAAKIASNAVTTIKIIDNAVSTAKIIDNAVTAIKVANDAISTAKIIDNAVTTAKVANNAITIAKLDFGIIQKVTGTIATGDVQTLNATPVEVIPAPPAGYFIQVLSCHWFLDFETTGYDAAASGDILTLKYTNAAGDAVVDGVAGDAIGAAAADYHVLVQPVAKVIPVESAAIVAHILAGEWYGAAGDSPLKYEITYRVSALDPTA